MRTGGNETQAREHQAQKLYSERAVSSSPGRPCRLWGPAALEAGVLPDAGPVLPGTLGKRRSGSPHLGERLNLTSLRPLQRGGAIGLRDSKSSLVPHASWHRDTLPSSRGSQGPHRCPSGHAARWTHRRKTRMNRTRCGKAVTRTWPCTAYGPTGSLKARAGTVWLFR